jgi:formylmethanofuran dehydrogenase subunit E
MKNAKLFKKHVQKAWEAIKGVYDPKYHPALRNTLLRIIAEDDTHFAEFVELMQVSGWDEKAAAINWFEGKKIVAKAHKKNDNVNKELDKAASTDVAIIQCKGCGQFTEATSAKTFSDGTFCDKCIDANNAGPLTHQCHYCGDMYTIADLTGAKEGLICYKCRHEMENRD